jgi:hypothetical protein
VSMQFVQPMSLQQLVVGFAVQRLPHRCFVDVYDLSNGLRPTMKSLRSHLNAVSTALIKPKKSAASKPDDEGPDGLAAPPPPPTVATTAQHLPMFCTSRMKYLNQLRAVIPVGGLPLAIVVVDQGAFVLDTTRGDVVARLREAVTSDAFVSGSLMSNIPSVGAGEPLPTDALGSVITAAGIDGAVNQAHIAAQSFAVVSADSVLLSPQGARRGPLRPALVDAVPHAATTTSPLVRAARSPSESSLSQSASPHPSPEGHTTHHHRHGGTARSDDFSVFRMDSGALVSEMYPVLEPLLSTTYGQLPPLLLEALQDFFHDIPHSRRNHATSAEHLGERLAALQQAQHQVATLHHSTTAGSVSHAGTGGHRSAQPSLLGGTMAAPQGDGRLSRNSTQSKAISTAASSKLRPSVTPAAASGMTPSSTAAALRVDDASAGWTGSIRSHITQREDTRHLRKDRVHDFWEAMKKR